MGGALTLLALCMAPEEAIIRDAMNGDGPTTPLVDCAAKALGLSAHFEPVRSWSAGEDLTSTEEQEGYGLIGRIRRMPASEYGEARLTRTLRDVVNPKVRGAALWAAHAFMATCHIAATNRPSGTTQDRQAALLSRSAPAGRHWLAQRQAFWPLEYRRARWIEVQEWT
jgi:hypothetical protein